MHADRTNRTASILLALILLLGGTALALHSFGVFGASAADRPIADNVVSAYFSAQGQWLWPVIAVLCLVIALLCLRWIFALLVSTDRVGELVARGDRTSGRTVLPSSSITNALCAEIETYPGVSSASARIIGSDSHPELIVQVALHDSADLAEVRTLIDTQAIAHVRQATDDPNLPITLELSMTAAEGARVR